MRPSVLFLVTLTGFLVVQLGLVWSAGQRLESSSRSEHQMRAIIRNYGLSDLCIATDARYIRHPAVSDRVAPFMDYPGSIEHFPTGSFWTPEP